MKISDLIEEYINEIITQNEVAELNRSALADRFNCVPSQINYVISTRFTPLQGYYVESQRGGGGYIKIQKVNITHSDYLMHIITSIGNTLTSKEADVFINNFEEYGIIDKKTAKLLKGATNDKVLIKAKSLKDELRADIFKNMLINLV